MKISPISKVNPYNIHKNNVLNKKSVQFTSHPDLDMLPIWFPKRNPMASSYFRRGKNYGLPCVGYQDIVDVYSQIFNDIDKKPKKILFVGVAKGQELFSHLATIKDIVKDKPIESVVDMHLVDLQSKPESIDIYSNSFYDQISPPMFSRSAFEEGFFSDNPDANYRIKKDITDYVTSICDNSSKAHWETRIQDAVKYYDDESFDIISINNVLPYIKSQNEIDETIKNFCRILKPGGILIADPKADKYSVTSVEFYNLEEIYDGIYQKPFQNNKKSSQNNYLFS